MKMIEGFAQRTEMREFRFYTQRDGLSSYNVHKILQDKNNFLWIATQDGLNRFDGNKFVVFNKGLESSRCLLSNDIRDIIYDSLTNILWVVCNQGGINGIDIDTYTVKYRIEYSNPDFQQEWRICAVMVDEKVYIGTSGGMEIFNTRSKSFETIDAGIALGLKKAFIRTLSVDPSGNLWIIVPEKGLCIFKTRDFGLIKTVDFSIIKNLSKSAPTANCGFFLNNCYWVGTRGGLIGLQYTAPLYDISINYFSECLSCRSRLHEINYITDAKEHELLIAGSGLFIVNTLTKNYTTVLPGSKGDEKWLTDITFCFTDTEHNFWIGCKQGLGLIKNRQPVVVPYRNSEAYKNKLGHLYAVFPASDDQFYVGTREGMYLVDHNKIVKTVIAGSFIQNIFSISPDNIIVSGGKGIQLIHHHRLTQVSRIFPELSPYQGWQLNSCSKLNDSICVIGTESNNGILIWNRKSHAVQNIQAGSMNPQIKLGSNIVNQVFATASAGIIVLSDYCLTEIKKEAGPSQILTIKPDSLSKPLGILMDITETSRYYYIAAYGEGLIRLDKQFKLNKIFRVNDGLSNSGVYKVFNYRDSVLIITTNRGLSFFNLFTERFERYFEEDGLQNNSFEEACGAANNDTFLAGGVEGFVKIMPSRLLSDTLSPVLRLNSIKIQKDNGITKDTFNTTITKYEIPSNALQTNIDFIVPDYLNAARIKYRYRINHAADWVELDVQNFITFSGMGPGKYNIEVIASVKDGIWNSNLLSLDLIFLPKWNQSFYFKMSLFLLLMGLLYLAYAYRIQQLKKQENIRAMIAKDLHDDIGSTLNSVKIFTHLAQSSTSEQRYFTQIETLLQQANAGLRDMIWVLDDSRDSLNDLVERIRLFALPLTNANNLEFLINIKSTSKKMLPKNVKRNLYLIGKECITNCIKYSKADMIHLDIIYTDSSLIFAIIDNGIGFSSNTPGFKPGNGLSNMKFRSEQIHFTFNMTSEIGKGTKIILTRE